jgi:hypothetical protein
MKTIVTCFVSVVLATSVHALNVSLFNTGVDSSATVLAGGSSDPHYNVLSPAGPAKVITSPNGSWLANDAVSKWIWVNADALPAGSFTFRTTFDMTGLDLLSAVITGRWSTDNIGTNILVNGTSTGQTSGGFSSFTAFSISAALLVPGVNTIDFLVTDQGSPGSFRAEFLTHTANASTQPPGVPDSGSTLILLGASFLLMLRASKKFISRRA